MRYYHYISDSKLEMLLPQIPSPTLQGLSAELGFNFGVISGKVSGTAKEASSRVARVEVVERYLENNNDLDVLQAPNWVRGRGRMKCGYLPDAKGMVLFAGPYRGLVLILAGSEAHLISGSSQQGSNTGWSFLPRVLDSLRSFVLENYDLMDMRPHGKANPAEVAPDYILGSTTAGSAFEALHGLPAMLPPPAMEVTFLARVFLVDGLKNSRFAIASPLYVAEAPSNGI
jgi:hypothetical protein